MSRTCERSTRDGHGKEKEKKLKSIKANAVVPEEKKKTLCHGERDNLSLVEEACGNNRIAAVSTPQQRHRKK